MAFNIGTIMRSLPPPSGTHWEMGLAAAPVDTATSRHCCKSSITAADQCVCVCVCCVCVCVCVCVCAHMRTRMCLTRQVGEGMLLSPWSHLHCVLGHMPTTIPHHNFHSVAKKYIPSCWPVIEELNSHVCSSIYLNSYICLSLCHNQQMYNYRALAACLL